MSLLLNSHRFGVGTVPADPSSLTATDFSSSQIDLSWVDNSNNEAGFRIERCTGAACSSFVEITTVGANVTTYSNTGLSASTLYRYRVRAYNIVGNSGYSNTAEDTTQAAGGLAANAGANRTVLTNEPIVLDGSASMGYDDLLQTNGKHSVQWEFGYGGWTYEGSLLAPIAYPQAGVYTVTLKCYDSGGALSSDTTTVTVTDVIEGTSTIIPDSGNPVSNGTSLANRISIDAGADNPVITLTAGAIYRMSCTLPNRTGAGYLTIRTSAFASLPNSRTRISPGDDANLAIIESDLAGLGGYPIHTPSPSTSNAHHYRFLGILWRKKTPSASEEGFVHLGANGAPTALNQLPHHIMFDRCRFDGGTTTSNTKRGIGVRGASDVAIVNSDFRLFKYAGADSQAVFISQGERLNVMNNYLDAAGENFMTGGEDPTITNHVPSYLVIRRNNFKKDLGYFSGAASFGATYYGVNFTVKNLLEIKNAKYVSIQGNIFENHWNEDQQYAIAFTVVNQDGGANWSTIQYLDFAHNKIDKFFWPMTMYLESVQVSVSIPATHWIVRHNAFTRETYYSADSRNPWMLFFSGELGGGDRIFIVSNSLTQNGSGGSPTYNREMEFATNVPLPTNVYNWNNIASGYYISSAGTGTAAIAASLGSSSFSKNLWYDPSSPNPSGSTTVADIAAVGYTNVDTDLTLTANLTAGLLGGRPGADIVTVDSLTAGVISGAW